MWERDWGEEYGGILYYRDVRGLPVQEYWHDMKFWWPQNEASIFGTQFISIPKVDPEEEPLGFTVQPCYAIAEQDITTAQQLLLAIFQQPSYIYVTEMIFGCAPVAGLVALQLGR